jgi:1,4-alpha-glucan branching enzyme
LNPGARPDEDRLDDFVAGRATDLWRTLGAHVVGDGVRFSVWAPHAEAVSVVGAWCDWRPGVDNLTRDHRGVWSGHVAGCKVGDHYKFAVAGADARTVLRADPMARAAQRPPDTASVVVHSEHTWRDDAWMARRSTTPVGADRLSIYEVHLGSWRPGAHGTVDYARVAEPLAEYVGDLGFTHVELMPVAEHPYGGSWGYQVTGFYAPTSRYGTPDGLRTLVDVLHRRGVGVLVDWVPAHFPTDDWALANFDGGPCYEPADPARALHPDWGTLEFDLARPEVRSFLLSNARYWISEFHVDGLRVDAVASMLYLDYSRGPGEWTPNAEGGNTDPHANSFLRELNDEVRATHPGVLVVAEESTAWPGVTAPVADGGLGFTHKWNMGWMHDTLDYFARTPTDRTHHHDDLVFSLSYADAERWVLPLSHDEVVHLKRSLIAKMPEPDRFGQLRALFAWMWAHPGATLLFMGGELAEEHEWADDRRLDWAGAEVDPNRAAVGRLLGELGRVASRERALWAGDGGGESFRWIAGDDAARGVAAIVRVDPSGVGRPVVCAAVLGPEPVHDYRIGVPVGGTWEVLVDSADADAPATGQLITAEPVPWHGCERSVVVDRPTPSVLWLAPTVG